MTEISIITQVNQYKVSPARALSALLFFGLLLVNLYTILSLFFSFSDIHPQLIELIVNINYGSPV
jgi:hypothetical protein